MYVVGSIAGDWPVGGAMTSAEHMTVGFESFFEAHHARLYSALCLVTGSRAESEELMQDAFLKLWERWDLVAALEDPEGYLYRTAMNGFRKRYRRAALALRRAVRAKEPADDFAALEERDSVLRALRGLKLDQRAALVLTGLRDYSSEEAARMLGTSPANVRMLASRARAALRVTMGEDR
jgi:RNA polymerase sigma-70 factor, ECF subfamily